MQRRVFIHNGDRNTALTRGLLAFEGWAGFGIHVAYGGQWTPQYAQLPPADLRLLISLPINPLFPKLIRDLRRDGAQVVVDVCFPFHIPDEIYATRLGEGQSAVAAWCDPANRRIAEQSMAEASWVSTSHPDWAAGLARYNTDTICIPDCHPDYPDTVTTFGRMLETLWDNPPSRQAMSS